MTEFTGPEQILENVPVRLNPDRICKALRIRSKDARSRIEAPIETSKLLIVARAVYRVCYIETKLEDAVVIDGVGLSSAFLRKNLEEPWRVLAYIVTIGDELDVMAKTFDDLLERYWLDFIGNAALSSAQKIFEKPFEL